MAQSFYKGIDTYVIYAEDSAFGTPGTPAGSAYVDKVTSFTGNVTNNLIRVQGIGEGRNATSTVNGVLDCNGSLAWELTDPAFLQYCFIGVKAGTGTAADPYEIQEANELGYGSGQVKTLTLEVGSNGGSNDDVISYDGVAVNTSTITFAVGETVKGSAEWIGRTAVSSATVETYVLPTNRPFTFVDGSVTAGSDVWGKLVSGNLTVANNITPYRSMGSRLIEQPVAGIRRYDFSLTFKHHYNDTASFLSGVEARGLAFSGLPAATTPLDGAQNTAVALSLDLVEGSGSGDRVVNFDFENAYIENISEPKALEEGIFESTVTGHALAGLTDGANKVPVRWWTIA